MSTRSPISEDHGETSHLASTIRSKLPVQVVLVESPLEASALRETLRVSSGCRVLLVEDNPINLFMMQKLLDKLQCRVDSAETGKEALERLAAEDYKVELLDIHLPDIDGSKYARGFVPELMVSGTHLFPSLLLTAHAMTGDRVDGQRWKRRGLPKLINN